MNNVICNLLDKGKLAQALIMLKEKVESLHNADLIEDYYQLQNTYNAYLHVLILSDNTNETDKPHQFLQKAYTISDKAERTERIQLTPHDEYCLSISSCELFYKVWTSDLWTKSEFQAYCDMLDTEDIITCSQLVNSTTLALLEMFDAKKLELLFEAYGKTTPKISKRAIVGIVLAMFKYSKRLYCYPEITGRISLLSDDSTFCNDTFQTLQILQYSKMTDKVDSTMKNDIMPALLKSAQYNENLKSTLGNVRFSDEGENPEWINKKAEKKIQKMAEMQNEGADIYYVTFAHFKSTQFFHKLSNWLLPYDDSIAQDSRYDFMFRPFSSETISKFLNFLPFCDNDKYSFVTLINTTGGLNTESIMSLISKDLPEDMSLDEIIKDRSSSEEQNSASIIRSHIRNLYRLFTTYPKRHNLPNPFSKDAENFCPINYKAFEFLTKQERQMLDLADFFMARGIYSSALEIYQFINPSAKEEDADIWQKMGYCCQKSGNAEQALLYYQEADTLRPGSQWTRLHISQAARESQDYKLSIKYIDQLLQNDEDNIKYIYQKSEDLISLGKYEEAIPLLYKVTYLNDKSLPAHKSLAFSLLMAKSFDKSEKEFQKCIDLGDLKSLVDIGHALLAQNEVEKACKLFSKGFKEYQNKQKSVDDFINDYWSYGRYLVRLGVKQKTADIVLETTLSKIV